MSEHPSRRHFLKVGLAVLPAVTLAPDSTVAAWQSTDAPAGPASSTAHSPRFFTEAEWAFMLAATAQLIPEDDLSPSAADCGVPAFIDLQMETPYGHGALWYMQGPFITDLAPELGYQQRFTPRDIYRLGIEGCDQWCQRTYGSAYFRLNPALQVEVLKQLEANALHLGPLSGSLFFAQLLTNTREGFFADPLYGGNRGMAGWKVLGFPGARADFMDWIDHPNTPYPLGPVAIDGQRG